MNESLVRKVESVLFSAGRRLSLEHISKLCKKSEEQVKEALLALQEELKTREDTSLRVVQEGESWKLTVREQFISTVEKLVTQTEYSKTVMETLAVIAYKAPVLQSEVIRIRTNKAYDHIKQLEEEGFITRYPKGRSKMIKLGQKFFDYFDLPEEVIAARFARVRQMEEEVKEHETEQKERKELIKQQKEELALSDEEKKKREQELITKLDEDIASIEPTALETYGRQETYTGESPTQLEKVEEHVGDLDVYESVPKEGEKKYVGDFEVYNRGKQRKGEEFEGPESEEEEFEPSIKRKTSTETSEGEPEEPQESAESETSEESEQEEGAEMTKVSVKEEGLTKGKSEEGEAPEKVELPKKVVPQEMVEVNIEKKEGKGMFTEGITKEVQGKIDKKIDELLHPPSEEEKEVQQMKEKESKEKQFLEQDEKKQPKENEEKSTPVEKAVKPAADDKQVPKEGPAVKKQEEEKPETGSGSNNSDKDVHAPPPTTNEETESPMFEQTSEGKSGMNPSVPEHAEPPETFEEKNK